MKLIEDVGEKFHQALARQGCGGVQFRGCVLFATLGLPFSQPGGLQSLGHLDTYILQNAGY